MHIRVRTLTLKSITLDPKILLSIIFKSKAQLTTVTIRVNTHLVLNTKYKASITKAVIVLNLSSISNKLNMSIKINTDPCVRSIIKMYWFTVSKVSYAIRNKHIRSSTSRIFIVEDDNDKNSCWVEQYTRYKYK